MRALILILLALTGPLSAFTPVLNLVHPRGGQRGSEMEVNFHGERLEGVEEALFYQPGLTLSAIEIRNPKHVVARLTIAPDALLGEHSLRLRTTRGLTQLRSFWVGAFPNVAEVEPNATFDQAQRVELNQTVNGIAGNEDDDYYVCSLKKGQRLSVEIEAMRLGRTMFDAYVAILDPRKFELASVDDTPLLRNDAFASIIAPEDGDYRILVHEAAYEGNENCQYRLHIGSFPRPKAVFPTGGKPGETLDFTFIGDPSGVISQTITLPPDGGPGIPLYPEHDGLLSPSPNRIILSSLDSVSESGGNHTRKNAMPVASIPVAIHGVLDLEEEDWFVFNGKKGQELVLRVLARSLRSPLDSILSVHGKSKENLANNDDQGSPDSMLSLSCPEDGPYHVRIRDQLGRCGPDFTYRIEITEKSSTIAATLPTLERNNSQKGKTFPVPRGNRYAALVQIVRENLSCEAVFEAGSLPAGVTLHCPPIKREMTSFPVVFNAAPDAPLAGGLHAFTIRSAGDAPPLVGSLTDTVHHIEINNEGPYHSATLDRIATAVIDEAPFKIDLEAPAVPIVKNGTLRLKVRATRNEGFAEKITVRFLWNPPGISGPVSIDLPGDQSEAFYELNASNDAAAAEWQVCVVAEASTPHGPVLVSSSLAPLKVSEPYVAMNLEIAATEQGKATTMLAKIETLQPFEGPAKVELIGLPHGTSCPPQSITKDQPEVLFPITVAPDARIGKHNGVFCQVHIPHHGGTVLHQTAMGGTLRIDAPAAPVAAVAAAGAQAPPAPPPPAAAPGTKPLSRLEQLRQRSK
jgi:hypothetical protein